MIIEVIAVLKEASRKCEQTIIMITHSRSITQNEDRILIVSDGVPTDLGRCRKAFLVLKRKLFSYLTLYEGKINFVDSKT